MADESLYPEYEYQPYQGDWYRYGFGPEHNFFAQTMPEPETEPVAPVIPADPLAPVFPVPGVEQGDNNDASDPGSSRSQREMSRAAGSGNAFDDLLPGKQTALSVLSLLTPGPIGAGIGLVNAGMGTSVALDHMRRMGEITGRPAETASKVGAGIAGASGLHGLSDYGYGIGGYGDISRGGYAGYMDMEDPGVAGAARAMARQSLNDSVGYDPTRDSGVFGDNRDPEGAYGGQNSDEQDSTYGHDYGGEGDYGHDSGFDGDRESSPGGMGGY